MRTTMAHSAMRLLLLACFALLRPAESIDIKMSALVFDPFNAVLRFEGYGKVGCSQSGSSLDACLKGGLEVYDTPAGDVTGYSLYMLSKLDTAPENPNYLCPPVVGDFDGTNITLTGYIDIEPVEAITLTVQSVAAKPNQFVLAFDTCEYVYKVEESFDRNTDGLPDFLGKKGEVADVLGAWATQIISQAISAVVAVTVFTNLGSQFLDKFMAMAGVEDLLAVASDLGDDLGEAGGALTPLLLQAQFLGISGQIGGKGGLPSSATRLSEVLSWTNFHVNFFGGTSDSANVVAARRNSVAAEINRRRQGGEAGNATDVNKCKKVETSATNLRSTIVSFAIGLGTSTVTRAGTYVKGYLDQPEADILAAGRLSFLQFFGFTSVAGAAKAVQTTLAGSNEIPVIQKGFMGIGEAALESAVSGCREYRSGAIATLVFLGLFFLLAWWIVTSASSKVDFNPTGPQPLGILFPLGIRLDEETEFDHELTLLEGQEYEIIPPPAAALVGYTSFGTPLVISYNGNRLANPIAVPQQGEEQAFFNRFQVPGQRIVGSRMGADEQNEEDMMKEIIGTAAEEKIKKRFNLKIKAAKIILEKFTEAASRGVVTLNKKNVDTEISTLNNEIRGYHAKMQIALQAAKGCLKYITVDCLTSAVNSDNEEKLRKMWDEAIENGDEEVAKLIDEQLEELETGGSAIVQAFKLIASPVLLPLAIGNIVKKFILQQILFRLTIVCKQGSGGGKKGGGLAAFDKFESFGGWKPKNAVQEKFLGRFGGLITDSNKQSLYFSAWLLVVLILQAAFIKNIANPVANAVFCFILKVADAFIRFYVGPQTNKDAAFNDLWATVTNTVQVGVITKFIADKSGATFGRRRAAIDAGQLVGGTFFDGDTVAQYFFGTAIVGLLPPLFAAIKESGKSVLRLIRKSRLAKAKAEGAGRKMQEIKDNPSKFAMDQIKNRPEFRELVKQAGINDAHIDAVAAITADENFQQFFNDLKNEYATFNNQDPPNLEPMKYAIERLKNAPQYQAKYHDIINLAYAKMSQITGRSDPAHDVEMIMTLIEKGHGVNPNQIGKDIAFYSGRASMVLFKLPWKVTSFFTGKQESADERRMREMEEAGKHTIDKDDLNIKIGSEIIQIKAGSKIEVKQAPAPKNGPAITYGMPTIMTVNGKSVPAMPAPWLKEPEWVDENWQQKLRIDGTHAPLIENPNARFILFDKGSVPQMVDDDKYRQVRRQLVPQMAPQPMQNSMMRSPQPVVSSMAPPSMRNPMSPNPLIPRPMVPTAPPSMGSAAPSMVPPPQGGMPRSHPGGPQGLYPGAPGR